MWLKEILNKSSTPHPTSLLKGLSKLPSEEAESMSCVAFSLLLGVRFGGCRVLKNAPWKDPPHPNPWNLWTPPYVAFGLTGPKRLFANVVKDFDMGRSTWIICMDPKGRCIDPYKREAEGGLTQKRRQIERRRPRCDRKSGNRALPSRAQPCWHLPSDQWHSFQTSGLRNWESMDCCCFGSPSLWSSFTAVVGN